MRGEKQNGCHSPETHREMLFPDTRCQYMQPLRSHFFSFLNPGEYLVLVPIKTVAVNSLHLLVGPWRQDSLSPFH